MPWEHSGVVQYKLVCFPVNFCIVTSVHVIGIGEGCWYNADNCFGSSMILSRQKELE